MLYQHFKEGSTIPPTTIANILAGCAEFRDAAGRINYSTNSGLFGLLEYDKFIPPSGSVTKEAAADYTLARLLGALVKKNKDFTVEGINPEANARNTWADCEFDCRTVNNRLRSMVDGNTPFPDDLIKYILTAKDEIAKILGPCPSVDDLIPRFGPGTVAESKSYDHKSSFVKLTDTCFVSPGTSSDVMKFFSSLNFRSSLANLDLFDPTEASSIRFGFAKLAFVPKNYKTFRPIIKEPGINQMIQMGIGTKIREALRHRRNNLNNNQQRNSALAKIGSIFGTVATIDFESASDRIAFQVVRLLLPEDWFYLLAGSRSSLVQIPRFLTEDLFRVVKGKKVKTREQEFSIWELAKFSSMGSGYTFELESLIFYALALAVNKIETGDYMYDYTSVHGDDVCLPTASAKAFVEVCEFLGFKINREKSFTEGPFRESCGKDYLLGVNVRPFYLKTNSPHSTYCLANWLFRNGRETVSEQIQEAHLSVIEDLRRTERSRILKKFGGSPSARLVELDAVVKKIPVYFGPPTESDSWFINPNKKLWVVDEYERRRHFFEYGFLPNQWETVPIFVKGFFKNSKKEDWTNEYYFSSQKSYLLSTMEERTDISSLFPEVETKSEHHLVDIGLTEKERDYKSQLVLCFD